VCNDNDECADGSDEDRCTTCYSCNSVFLDGEAWEGNPGNNLACGSPTEATVEVVQCPGTCYADYATGTTLARAAYGVERGCLSHASGGCVAGIVEVREVPDPANQQLSRIRQCCEGDRCLPECSEDEFQCSNGQCVQQRQVCNSVDNCVDGSDEVECAQCYGCTYREVNGVEVPEFSQTDCAAPPEGGDPELQMNCNGNCFIQYTRGDDFFNIVRGCFLPPVGEVCVPGQQEVEVRGENFISIQECCAGENCNNRDPRGDACLPEFEFTCGNNNCIPLPLLCDGTPNCDDGSDEQGCTQCYSCNYVLVDGEEFEEGTQVQCEVPGSNTESRGCQGTCFVDFARAIQMGSPAFGVLRGCVTAESGGCVQGPAPRPPGVEPPNPAVDELESVRQCCSGDFCETVCDAGQFRCGTGQCISSDSVCDNTPDCFDGSDEDRCTECYSCDYALVNGEAQGGDPETCGNPSEGGVEPITCPGQCHVDFGRALVLGQPGIGLLRGCVSHASGGCVDGPAPDPERVGPPDLTIDDRETVRQCCEGALCESVCNSETQFTCENSQCIAQGATCDGTADCFDGSDETDSLCDDDSDETDDSGHMLKPSFSLQVLMAASAIGLVINALLHI